MPKVQAYQDPESCAKLWERFWPKKCLFDLWEIRSSFMRHYNRQNLFILREGSRNGNDFLPLSWIDEEGYFGQFPGETWKGKTWLEQNKIVTTDPRFLDDLMDNLHGKVYIRYLDAEPLSFYDNGLSVDEAGYLFYPEQYNYSFENYFMTFSKKTRKNFNHELRLLHDQNVHYRYNHMPDIDWMFEKNLSVYNEDSYFYDSRFFKAFIDMLEFLKEKDLLVLSSVLIGGRLAAVDVGALWGNVYTVLAGGAEHEFQGIAKLINFHHLELACSKRFDAIDFLCGDFSWKSRFHLTPRPLYKLCLPQVEDFTSFDIVEDRISIAA
jgi:hypothetical protein